MDSASVKPDSPGKDVQGDLDQFKEFARRILSVPYSEIQQRMEAEKQAKASASLAPASDKTNR